MIIIGLDPGKMTGCFIARVCPGKPKGVILAARVVPEPLFYGFPTTCSGPAHEAEVLCAVHMPDAL